MKMLTVKEAGRLGGLARAKNTGKFGRVQAARKAALSRWGMLFEPEKDLSIFWRESNPAGLSGVEMAEILCRRRPRLLPLYVSKHDAQIFVRRGSTVIESAFRRALVRNLYRDFERAR